MCGIFCLIQPDSTEKALKQYDTLLSNLKNRGPDYYSMISLSCGCNKLTFATSVLWLQGTSIVKQPIETDGSVFVYNGDIFGGNLIPDALRNTHGDTQLLFESLETSASVRDTLARTQGPYAFIYLDKHNLKLYFGRDIYGRRSLLLGKAENTLVLTSTACRHTRVTFIELPAIGIFCYDLTCDQLELTPWTFLHSNFKNELKKLEDLLEKTVDVNLKSPEGEPQVLQLPTETDLLLFKRLAPVTNTDVAFELLLQDEQFSAKVRSLRSLLEAAVQKRIATQPGYCHECIESRSQCSHALSGVLFSGGIDCAILTLLADKFTPKDRPIDLLNVAFNPNAPDRATALETLNELENLCPDRVWNFVPINVTPQELSEKRQERVADLIYPLNTILDDSLGCALWFAARGQSETYRSPCRVLLVGMGADELFGGYTKHRAALRHGGWASLNQSLETDWQNISRRNLARDDRVVSDHARQLRTPYLDENLVEFVRKLNCWERTCPLPELPQGFGEKILLRSLGYCLGLKKAAGFKKRALQFGSRIANSKENANDVSPRL